MKISLTITDLTEAEALSIVSSLNPGATPAVKTEGPAATREAMIAKILAPAPVAPPVPAPVAPPVPAPVTPPVPAPVAPPVPAPVAPPVPAPVAPPVPAPVIQVLKQTDIVKALTKFNQKHGVEEGKSRLKEFFDAHGIPYSNTPRAMDIKDEYFSSFLQWFVV